MPKQRAMTRAVRNGSAAPAPQHKLDDLDRQIIAALTDDARASARSLARSLGVAAGTVGDRIARMEHAGVITGYTASIAPWALGRPLAIIVGLSIQQGHDLDVALDELLALAEVERVEVVTGPWDVLVFAHVADPTHLNEFLMSGLWRSPWFRHSQTMLVIDSRSVQSVVTPPTDEDG